MKVLLISGLGPCHLEIEDTMGCGVDKSLSKVKKDSYYVIDGIDYNPDKLVYKYDGDYNFVLRKENTYVPDLISSVLKNILMYNDIEFEYIPISNIWNDKKFSTRINVEIICLSTSFMWSLKMLDKAIKWIRKNCSSKYLILGGQYSSIKTEHIIKSYMDIDFIIKGDGEYSLPLLVKLIISSSISKQTILKIPNLVFRDNYGHINRTFIKHENLEELPYTKYEDSYNIVPYVSMRGCPFKCKFCALRVSTPKWRYLSAERILNDWKNYKEINNVKHIDINDSSFFIPFERMKKLLKNLQSLNMTWEANSRVDIPVDEDFIKLLEKSNCTALFFGFESMSEEVLNFIGKKTSTEQNRKINELFKTSSINTMMSFIVGFPGETPEEFDKTSKYLINEHYGSFNIYVFEFEDENMPIWKEKENFNLKIYEDENSHYWEHNGLNWSHCGMNSSMASKLRFKVIRDVRMSNSKAIHRSWQYDYKWPFIPNKSRKINLEIEKLIDRLVFVMKDYKDDGVRKSEILKIIKELEVYDIYPNKKLK